MMKKSVYLVVLFCFLITVSAACSEDGNLQQDSQPAAVDVDLTHLNNTMIMAKLNNIIDNSEDYMGKTIKISGPYVTSYYDKTDMYYHYVMIDACCMGFEFIWNGEHTYPDDYPEENTYIEVTGIFGSYEELGRIFYYLAVDDIVIS